MGLVSTQQIGPSGSRSFQGIYGKSQVQAFFPKQLPYKNLEVSNDSEDSSGCKFTGKR